MSRPPYLAGIDLGTTTCRCLILDLDGNPLGAARREITLHYPQPLWAELDPDIWWTATAAVVREAIAASKVCPEQIAAVGMSGLMHAPVLLDGGGRPVAPVMLWLDQRCSPQVARLRAVAGGLGGGDPPLGTTHTAAKLCWIAECQPDVLRQTERMLLPKDFIRYRLTGTDGTDVSDASGTGMYDRRGGTWKWALIDAAGIPRRLLPAIRTPETLAGQITPEAAEATGLSEGTPVAVGGGDALCTRLGAGPLRPAEVYLYLGTSAWIARADRPGPGRRWGMVGFGATSTTGAALRWLRDALVPIDGGEPAFDYSTLVEHAAQASAGAEGLFFLPHLMGERGPFEDPLARGALVGLTLRHKHEHMARAVLEGTVFQLRRILEAQAAAHPTEDPPTSGIASGGAARSPIWMQLIADVTGLTLRVPEVVETAAIGAAMLGAAAAGLLPLDLATVRMTHPGPVYAPDPASGREYEAAYARFRQLDDLLAPWFRESP